MTLPTNKNAYTNQSTLEVEPVLYEDMLQPTEKILMKCDQCGCEMELDAWILEEMADDNELSCICMKCSRGTMYPLK